MEPEAAKALARIQIAMWCDGKTKCLYCNKIYLSVDDFLERDPRNVSMKNMKMVDDSCWEAYQLSLKENT